MLQVVVDIINHIVFTYNPYMYNSIYVNEFVEVEHRKKSLDYRSLMKIVNQCETTHR
jgi:hypothetical protein